MEEVEERSVNRQIESRNTNKRITKVWQLSSSLRSYSKILLLYLVHIEEHFYPVELFNREIEEDTGLRNSQIHLAIQELSRKGLIETNPSEGSKAKIYKINL